MFMLGGHSQRLLCVITGTQLLGGCDAWCPFSCFGFKLTHPRLHSARSFGGTLDNPSWQKGTASSSATQETQCTRRCVFEPASSLGRSKSRVSSSHGSSEFSFPPYYQPIIHQQQSAHPPLPGPNAIAYQNRRERKKKVFRPGQALVRAASVLPCSLSPASPGGGWTHTRSRLSFPVSILLFLFCFLRTATRWAGLGAELHPKRKKEKGLKSLSSPRNSADCNTCN